MQLDELKNKWNDNLRRIKKAEKISKDNPELFIKYIEEFHKICRVMSSLMYEYKNITGDDIPEEYFEREWK